MKDPTAVTVSQRGGDAQQNVPKHVFGQAALLGLASVHIVLQRSAAAPGHDQVQRAVVLEGAVVTHDAGMRVVAEGGEHSHFCYGGGSLLLVHERDVNLLYCHDAAVVAANRAVHDALRALSDTFK